jgi:two-component system, OmpR family, phosphate regulon response regulator PhoB
MDRKPLVLVVEDEDNIAIALDYLMTREGYDHVRVASGADALPRIRDTHPNLRMDPKLSDVKVLMMTARGSAIERRKGLALGADGFISKPFELKDLRDKVRKLLEGA